MALFGEGFVEALEVFATDFAGGILMIGLDDADFEAVAFTLAFGSSVCFEEAWADSFKGLASSQSESASSTRFLLGAFGEPGNALIASDAGMSPIPSFFRSETLIEWVMNVHIAFVTLALDLISWYLRRTSARIWEIAEESCMKESSVRLK